ncbi:MAG: hypothetical protein IJC52_03925 [Clostridia bacterium]|nr:hypothetical protein [Clostridia bacterium]
MKRWAALLMICVMLAGFTACGNVSGVQVADCASDVYSDADIASAIRTAKRYFFLHFSDCTLQDITYIGDAENEGYEEFASRHDAEEVIVLTSTFDVGASGGDGSLNPDSTYTHWKWILVRNRGGVWRHADHGY